MVVSSVALAKVKVLKGEEAISDDGIREEYPVSNYGGAFGLEIGTPCDSSGYHTRKAFIKPEMILFRNHATVVDSVHLIIFGNGGSGDSTLYFYINRLLVDVAYGSAELASCPYPDTSVVYNAYRCLCLSSSGTSCGGDSIPWNGSGCSGSGSDYVATVTDSFQLGMNSGDSVIIDITDDVEWFCDHPDSVFGWVLWRDFESDSGSMREIMSTEVTSSNGIYQPRLEIHYTTKQVAFVLNDTSSAAAIGVDSMLYKAMRDDLDYEVSYMTDDDVIGYGSAYFDTAYDVVIWAGNEVAGASPSSRSQTIQDSYVGWVSLYKYTFDESNLGIGEVNLTDDDYVVIDKEHWITKVLQDTLFLFMDGIATANIRFAPDSMHNIKPLILDENETNDSSNVVMCAADSGDTVYNGDILKGRRVFLGLFHSNVSQRDSCQFYTIFNRAVAWCAADTNNCHLHHNACFSGWMEVEDAWGENSSGNDSIQSYGGWSDLYTGVDYDEKVTFMKVANGAMGRKLPYNDVLVDQLSIRTKVKQVSNGAEDSLWESTNGIRLLKLEWWCGRETGSDTSSFVSWTYRYIDPPDSFPWNQGGAHSVNVDVVDTVLDSIRQSMGNTGSDSVFSWQIDHDFAQRMIEDTTANHGWVWHNFYNNQSGGVNDAEILYHSANVGDPRNKPLIIVRLARGRISEFAPVVRRRYPLIGHGLLGGVQ